MDLREQEKGAEPIRPCGGQDACGCGMPDAGTDTVVPESGATQHYDVLKELGDCYASVSKYDQAQQCYEKAANLAPDEAGPYIGLGVVALQQNLPEDAETAFKVACRLNNSCAEGYCGLAMVYQQRADYEQAFEMYLKCLELDTDNVTAILGLFQTSCQMGSFAKVIYYLEAYLDMHPGDTAVMFCLATLYAKQEQFYPAKKLLSDVLVLEPGNKDAANLLEEIQHKLAQIKQAGAGV